MSHPASDKPARVLSIGLIAYGMDGHDPSKVFVRVPTERGRWVLTDRCVVEVACRCCESGIGEPCRQGRKRVGHGAGTHAIRREDWQRARRSSAKTPVPKLRITAEDLHPLDPEGEAQ